MRRIDDTTGCGRDGSNPSGLGTENAKGRYSRPGGVLFSGNPFKMILQSIPRDFFSSGMTRTVLATVAAHGNSICVGLSQGFSAVMLPQIADPGSTLTLTSQEASWVASLGVISNPLGAVAAGAASEVFGRRAAVRYAAAPYLIGWLLIALADDFVKLCIGRFISGVAVGMATSSYLYVAEVSGAEHRGTLCASGPVFVSVGVLLVYVAGAFTSWTTVAALSCVASVIAYLAATAVLPETPPWLVSRGRLTEARTSLEWLRGSGPNSATEIEKELAALMDASNAANESQNMKDSTNMGNSRFCSFMYGIFSLFARPQVWKPFILLLIFFAFQEASGIYVLLYYAVDLFRSLEAGHRSPAMHDNHPGSDVINANGWNLNITVEHAERVLHNVEDHSSGIAQGFLASIAVAGVRLAASIGGACLMQRFGRRHLAMTSGAGMALSMAVAGGYEFAFAEIPTTEERPAPWVPLACVLAHVCISMIGFLQLPWVMTSELFPQNARGIAGGSVSALAHLLIFTSVKTYPDLEAWAGVPFTLWLFSGSAAIGAVFVYLFLPETKGKTLSEIEEEFAGGKDSRCSGIGDGICHICGQQCNSAVDSLSVVIVKAKHDHHDNDQNPHHKSLAAILKKHCFSGDANDSHKSFVPSATDHVKENALRAQMTLTPNKLQDENIHTGVEKSSSCNAKRSFWRSIFQRRREDYVAGTGTQGVTAISVINVEQNEQSMFNSFREAGRTKKRREDCKTTSK